MKSQWVLLVLIIFNFFLWMLNEKKHSSLPFFMRTWWRWNISSFSPSEFCWLSSSCDNHVELIAYIHNQCFININHSLAPCGLAHFEYISLWKSNRNLPLPSLSNDNQNKFKFNGSKTHYTNQFTFVSLPQGLLRWQTKHKTTGWCPQWSLNPKTIITKTY